MVSNIDDMRTNKATPVDIQRYAMDIINMNPNSDGDKYLEQSRLGRIIMNAPHLTVGLTPYALELAKQGYRESLDCMLAHAPEYIDPIAVELFAKTALQQAPLQKEFQVAATSLILDRIIKALPDLKPTIGPINSEIEETYLPPTVSG